MIRGASPDKEDISLAVYNFSEPTSARIVYAEIKLTPGMEVMM